MERFKCSECATKFIEINDIFKHMKIMHGYKDNVQKMKCVVISNNCVNTFSTFTGLRKHINKCLTEAKFEKVCGILKINSSYTSIFYSILQNEYVI